VAKSIPSYLRIFTEQASRPSAAPIEGATSLGEVCQAFERVTGWSLRNLTEGPKPRDIEVLWSAPVESGQPSGPGQLRVGVAVVKGDSPAAQTDLTAAADLAMVIAKLWCELEQTRESLRRREAELAAGVPLVPHHSAEQHLADRLEQVLRGGAEAVGCHAAALYLLDEGTTELKLRSRWGLPQQRLLDSARPLKRAAADLEALAGHAVVLEDAEPYREWNLPESCSAAVCVPVSTPTTPLGTLWLFSNEPRPFSDQEVNLVEIVAGRIAADLEREMLMSEGVEGARIKQQLAAAERFEQNQRPHISPLVEDWDVAGWTEQAGPVGGDFYDWFVQPEDRLALAVGDCSAEGLEAALTASSLRSAVRSYAEYIDQPARLLDRINQTLWSSSAGDQSAGLLYAIAAPEDGRIRLASAGQLGAYLLSAEGAKALFEPSLMLGMLPENRYAELEKSLFPGEAIVILTDGIRAALEQSSNAAERRLLEGLVPHLRTTANELVGRIRDQILSLAGSHVQDRTVLILKRRGSPAR
jgi:phosphoserine phosphatase RsbU/P